MEVSKKSARIAWSFLLGVIVCEGAPLAAVLSGQPIWFLENLGFHSGPRGNLASWLLAVLVAIAFAAGTIRQNPQIWTANRLSALKVVAVVMAIVAGTFEEGFFRRFIMDLAAHRGWSVFGQIVLSAVVFGVAHGIWGLFARNIRPAVTATIATSLIGGAWAVVYIVGGRSLAPCIVSHILINFVLEPGMMLSAASGQWNQSRAAA